MPLIAGCAYANPVALAYPAAPNAVAPALAPAQGDHLFGDVLGTIETAFQSIFGGGALWITRMKNYKPQLEVLWAGLGTVDFGHGAHPPVVQRNGAHEPDEHAHIFGGYSLRLQWQLAEIVCTGFTAGMGGQVETRRVGGATKAWKKAVLKDFDALLDRLVDSTAIASYIADPAAIRQADAAHVRHTPMSLTNAVIYAQGHNGNGNGKLTVQGVLKSYESLRNSLIGLLDQFTDNIKTLNPNTDTWV